MNKSNESNRAYNVSRWLYKGHRPNQLAKVINNMWAVVQSWGILPHHLATLEVVGRKSGKVILLPVVLAIVDGERYLVSMLGDQAQWVLNIHATGGKAFLRCGGRTEIRLDDVPASQRAPILKDYLRRAPGARPHISVDKDAPLSEFEAVAGTYPVFRIVSV